MPFRALSIYEPKLGEDGFNAEIAENAEKRRDNFSLVSAFFAVSAFKIAFESPHS